MVIPRELVIIPLTDSFKFGQTESSATVLIEHTVFDHKLTKHHH